MSLKYYIKETDIDTLKVIKLGATHKMEDLYKISAELEKDTLQKKLKILFISLGISIFTFGMFLAMLPKGHLSKMINL